MDSLLSGLSEHGYSILIVIIFMEAIGLPVPAALALLIAGGVSARGSLHAGGATAAALAAMLVADTLMFLLGRYTGWWLLGILCRLSLNPESCILRSADSFYRRGRTLLLFAKFIPGINTMAPPLAGSMNMRLSDFLRLDFVGAAFYICSWFGFGFLFSDALDSITRGYHTFGQIFGWTIVGAVAGYLMFKAWIWVRSLAEEPIPRVHPAEAAELSFAGTAIIYDVRSHGYYDEKAMRIQGSRRLEPNSLNQTDITIPSEKQVYLYCTCVREATSSRVAGTLLKKGIRCAVIAGGLRAWKKAGLPMEAVPRAEMVLLPVFES